MNEKFGIASNWVCFIEYRCGLASKETGLIKHIEIN